jgi:AbrB family looped-hinge helix DNA binding protein
MTITKTVRLSQKGQLVIPQEMRQALGLEAGDELLITFEEGRMILTRPEQYARTTRGLLKGTWGRTKQEVARYLDKERQSWE